MMAEKKSELQKLSDWMGSWGSSLYERTNGKTMPQKPKRESLAPAIYKTLTGREYPTDPEVVIRNRTVSNEGLIDFSVGGHRIVAPKNGVLGYMIPGKPDTWVADGDKIYISEETREKAKARWEKATGKKLTLPESDPPKTDPPKTDPPKTEPPKTAPPKTDPPQQSPRVNANGLVSYGKDLSSLNQFTSTFTGGYEVADIKSSFQSNDLPSSEYNGSNKISTEETPYELPSAATPSNVGGKYAMGGVNTSLQSTGYKIDGKSVPGTVGGNPTDPQDGTSDKPDVAESIRTVRMERQSGRGSRRDPRNRGEDPDMFGGPEPSDASLVSPMYANKKRNAIRDAFFAGETSVKGAVAANAVAGFGKDSNADARFNVGGKLVYAKDGMQQKAKNAAMMGQDPSQFLDISTTPDTQPDTPAASELSIAPQSAVKPGTITAPENNGGSLETTAPITKPSPEKFQEAQDFLTNNMQMLNRRTK